MTYQWVDSSQTTIRREVPGGEQFIEVGSDGYRQFVLPWLAEGNAIAPSPEPPQSHNYSRFREEIALTAAYERILDAIAGISPTRHSSIVHVWSEVKDIPTLSRAAQFWNAMVVKDAAITAAEVTAIQNLVNKFGLPVVVASNGSLSVSSP